MIEISFSGYNMGFIIFISILIGSFAYAIREILNAFFPRWMEILTSMGAWIPNIFSILIVGLIFLVMFGRPRDE